MINKIHDTFDVMDASSLPSALTSSLVVALTVVIHPDQLWRVSDAAIKVAVA